MARSLGELATLAGGNLHGDPTILIDAAAPLDEAGPGEITFLASKKHAEKLARSRASAAIVATGFSTANLPYIAVDDPLAAMLTVARALDPPAPEPRPGVDPRAAIDPSAKLGVACSIGPFAVIGAGAVLGDRCVIHSHAVVGAQCVVGDDVVLHPHSVLYPKSRVASRAILHAGVVVGGDGFGYRFAGGRHEKIPQLGRVEIGPDVEVGCNSTIDRATFGATRVGEGTKIDNLVMVGHNNRIGSHVILCSQAGIAGSCELGDYVVLGGQAGLSDHLRIGAGTQIGPQAGLNRDLGEREAVLGAPALPIRHFFRNVAQVERIGEMREDIKQIREFLKLPRLDEGDKALERRRAAG